MPRAKLIYAVVAVLVTGAILVLSYFLLTDKWFSTLFHLIFSLAIGAGHYTALWVCAQLGLSRAALYDEVWEAAGPILPPQGVVEVAIHPRVYQITGAVCFIFAAIYFLTARSSPGGPVVQFLAGLLVALGAFLFAMSRVPQRRGRLDSTGITLYELGRERHIPWTMLARVRFRGEKDVTGKLTRGVLTLEDRIGKTLGTLRFSYTGVDWEPFVVALKRRVLVR
jgi:hypothetical protein